MILILKDNGAWRLCQDNKWRSFANFGTYPECVKQYRSLGHARRKAKKVKGQVAVIPEGVTIEAGGAAYDDNGQRNLKEFVV